MAGAQMVNVNEITVILRTVWKHYFQLSVAKACWVSCYMLLDYTVV